MQQVPSHSSHEQKTAPSATPEPQATTAPKETTSPVASMPSSSPNVPQPEDPYDFDTCTIVAVVQLRPRSASGHARQVLLSVQNGTANKEDLPLYRLLTENELGGPFPPALVSLFEELMRQLPERKLRHEQRMRAKTKPASTPSKTAQQAAGAAKEKRSQKKVAATSTAAKPLPPVPTATPPPKNDLVLAGFDWFEAEQH